MKLVLFAALFEAVALATCAKTYPVTANGGLKCRSGPGSGYKKVIKTYPKGAGIQISCQTPGTSVNGNNIWIKTQDNCYVADYFVRTGINGYVAKRCSTANGGGGGGGGGGGSKIPGPVTNDYPYKNECGPADKWLYFKCQCTSFVAWRINERLGVKFHNQYKGYNWGNANTWNNAAKATGVKVNNTPKPGAIAQTDKGGGGAGHVAWVTAVNGNHVTIEEYNYDNYRGYGTRTVPKSEFRYIHIK